MISVLVLGEIQFGIDLLEILVWLVEFLIDKKVDKLKLISLMTNS